MRKFFNKKNIGLILVILAVYAIVQGLIAINIIDSYLQFTLATICINIILAVSLNLISGFTGLFSLGHAGFMGIGAYTCALITLNLNTPYSFLLGIIAGAVLAAVMGLIIGLPTLRLKGDYLAIATLGMAEIIRIVLQNLEFTGGAAGLSDIPKLANWTWLYFFMILTIVLSSNFIQSSHGRACISIREDETASEIMGINTTQYKVTAFVIGAFFAGIAGALYASNFYVIKPDLYGFMPSINILVIVVIGGMGSLRGSVIAAALLAVLSVYLRDFPEITMILYGLILVVVMLLREFLRSRKIRINVFDWHKLIRIGNER